MGFLSDKQIEQFEALIKGYQMNTLARAEFVASHFAIIAGPTGAGKDTIRNLLIKKDPDRYTAILSTTTRSPRKGEKDGVDYHFRSEGKVKKSLETGEFFQAALVHNQQVSCLHINEIKKLRSGQIGLSILIVQTERELSKTKTDIKTVFLVPPSLNELKRRLQSNRQIKRDEMLRRLLAAQKELKLASDNPDYLCLINENIEKTAEKCDQFFAYNKSDPTDDKKARRTIDFIVNELDSAIIEK